jgi:hypothetical protein
MQELGRRFSGSAARRGQRIYPDCAGNLRAIAVGAVPFLPVEIVLLPRWFPFHLYKISYWSRTVMVPLLILWTAKARARKPKNIPSENCLNAIPGAKRLFSHALVASGLFLSSIGSVKLYPLYRTDFAAAPSKSGSLDSGTAEWRRRTGRYLSRDDQLPTKRSGCSAIR